MAEVFLTEDAKEDLRDLDGAARKIVAKALVKLRDEPEKRGQPLGANAATVLTGFRKLVVGDRTYRIVYRVEANGSVCVVWVIGKRADSEVYNVAKARAEKHPDPTLAAKLTELLDTAFSLQGKTPLD